MNTSVIRNTLNELLSQAQFPILDYPGLLDSLKIQEKTKEEAKCYFCSLDITTEEEKKKKLVV